jgi:hypothetical protein
MWTTHHKLDSLLRRLSSHHSKSCSWCIMQMVPHNLCTMTGSWCPCSLNSKNCTPPPSLRLCSFPHCRPLLLLSHHACTRWMVFNHFLFVVRFFTVFFFVFFPVPARVLFASARAFLCAGVRSASPCAFLGLLSINLSYNVLAKRTPDACAKSFIAAAGFTTDHTSPANPLPLISYLLLFFNLCVLYYTLR